MVSGHFFRGLRLFLFPPEYVTLFLFPAFLLPGWVASTPRRNPPLLLWLMRRVQASFDILILWGDYSIDSNYLSDSPNSFKNTDASDLLDNMNRSGATLISSDTEPRPRPSPKALSFLAFRELSQDSVCRWVTRFSDLRWRWPNHICRPTPLGSVCRLGDQLFGHYDNVCEFLHSPSTNFDLMVIIYCLIGPKLFQFVQLQWNRFMSLRRNFCLWL